MNDQEIIERAQQIAHANSAACRNRPECFAKGHGKACMALATVIANAMREAAKEGAGGAGRKPNGEPQAFLVTQGRVFQDRVFLTMKAAEASVATRNDGAVIRPLVFGD